MNRNIIIIAIVVIIIAIVGIFLFAQPHSDGKIDTQINFLSENTLKNGEAVQFELKDKQGNALANENLNITFEKEDGNETYNIVTDENGKGALVLNGENPGTYKVYVVYNGTDKYNGYTAAAQIVIEEGTSEESTDSSASSTNSTASNTGTSSGSSSSSSSSGNSSNSNLHYDSKYNFYYDDDGIIRGGQSDGMSADYVRQSYESGNMVDEEGNLQ